MNLQVMPGSPKHLFGSRVGHQARQLAAPKKACCSALLSQVLAALLQARAPAPHRSTAVRHGLLRLDHRQTERLCSL